MRLHRAGKGLVLRAALRPDPVPIGNGAAGCHKHLLGTQCHGVGGHVLGADVHGLAQRYAQALALADRVACCALVRAHARAVGCEDGACLIRATPPALKKGQVVAVGHEADVLALGLVGVAEALLLGDGANFRLRKPAQGEHRARELVLRECVEHVALILCGVGRLAERATARLVVAHLHVMSRGDVVAAQLTGAVQEQVELHEAVAVDAGVGREAALIGTCKAPHDTLLELLGHVKGVVGDAESPAHAAGILDVVDAAAGLSLLRRGGWVVPQAHGGSHAVVALLGEQVRGHARIHAAAHGDKHACHVVPLCQVAQVRDRVLDRLCSQCDVFGSRVDTERHAQLAARKLGGDSHGGEHGGGMRRARLAG